MYGFNTFYHSTVNMMTKTAIQHCLTVRLQMRTCYRNINSSALLLLLLPLSLLLLLQLLLHYSLLLSLHLLLLFLSLMVASVYADLDLIIQHLHHSPIQKNMTIRMMRILIGMMKMWMIRIKVM